MAGGSTSFTATINVVANVGDAVKNIKSIQTALETVKLPNNFKNSLNEKFKSFYKEAEKYQDMLAKGPKTKGDASALERSGDKVLKIYESISKELNSIDNKTLKNAFKDMGGAEVERLKEQINEIKNNLSNVAKESKFGQSLKTEFETALTGMSKLGNEASTVANKLKTTTFKTFTTNLIDGRFDLAVNNLKSMRQQIEQLKDDAQGKDQLIDWITKLENGFNELKQSDGINSLIQQLTQLKGQLNGAAAQAIEKLIQDFTNMSKAAEQSGAGLRKVTQDTNASAKGTAQLNSELDQLKNRITYFFGLSNGVMLFRRALRDAINTTKELDAVMTQTAVVSDKTVGDMWKTLPEYSKEAKKLGAQIKDVYSAQTLYVQQGLDMNSAMDLGVETLKMARVAGIDAAEATNSMTAALRGFNMELNESSAVRINDVYSKLAQNTASNVQEISTAMTKTAALANSANMSFENTAAFLATIIESTREGAETAGTALKTVIARFTEVKKLYSEGELTGTDEEGQEVDVNKISAALRTAGINMNDFFTGAKGLDEIFMELGSKWDSLTTIQQRYIATMAAGSRQQSRFLALMQNYSRTMELTQMAYNSAGSGQEQFEKTLDSLEAKINQFKAAWDTFVMGIANSDFIKGVIDAGTKILELINKIIDSISGGNGMVKSVASIATAFGVFRGGRGIFNLLIGGVNGKGGLLGPIIGKFFGDKEVGEQAAKGFLGSFADTIKKTDVGQKGIVAKSLLRDFYKNNFTLMKDVGFKELDYNYISESNKISMSPELGTAIHNYNKSLKEFGTNSKEAAESQQILAEKMKAAGASEKEINGLTKQTSVNIAGISNACLLAGGGLIALSSIIDKLVGKSTVFTKVLRSIGVGLVVYGAGMKIATAATAAFGVALEATPIGWIITAIAAVTALGVALYQLVPTAKKLAKELTEFSEQAGEGAEKVRESYESVKQSLEEINSKSDSLNDVIQGTEEWDAAVQSLNQSILELIELFPQLGGAIEYINGHLTLNKKSNEYKQWIEEVSNAAKNSYIAKNATEIATIRASKRADTAIAYRDYYDDNFIEAFKNNSNEIYIKKTFEEDKFKETLGFLEEDIKNLSIYNKDTLRNALKSEKYNLNEQQQKLIYSTLGGHPGISGDWNNIDFNNINFEFIVDALKNKSKYENSLNKLSIQTVQDALENSVYKNDEFSNMYFKIGKDTFKKIYEEISEEAILNNKNSYRDEFASALNMEVNQINEIALEEYTRQKITEKQLYKTYSYENNDKTNFGKFVEAFNQFNDNEKAIANALITNNDNLLTLSQIKSSQDFNKELFGYSQKTGLDIYKEYQDYYTGTSKNYQSEIENFSNTVGQVKDLINTVNNIRASNGDVDNFFEIIQGLENLSDEAKNIIATTDFTKAENIHNLTKSLQELGYAVGSDFTNKLVAATGAVYTYSAATVKTSVEALEGAKSSYEKMLEGQRKFTEEEYARFAQLEGFNSRDWIKSGTNEYTYLGETNSILSSIESMVAKLTKQEPEQLKQRIKEANQLSSNIEELNYTTSTTGENAGKKVAFNGFTITNENGEKEYVNATDFATAILSPEGTKFDDDQLKSFADQLSIDVGDATGKVLLSNLQVALADYGNIKGLESQLAILQNERTAIALQSLSGQAILNNEYDQGTFEGRTTEDLLQAKLEIGDVENIEYLKKQMGLTADEAKEYDDVLKALTIDSKVSKINFDNLTKAYKDNADALTEEGKKTNKYGAALAQLTVAAKKAFNNNENITTEFVEKHLDQFSRMANGDESALKEIRKDLEVSAKETLKNIDGNSKAAEAFEQIIAGLDGTDFSVVGAFDASNIINGLNLTWEQAKAVQKKLNSIGWSANINPIGYDEYGVPTGYKLVINNAASDAIRNAASGSGGGGGGKEFKNDFDKYYNMVEDINELTRLRNLLETDYQQLLESEAASGKAIYDNLKKQVDLLKERRDITADLAEKRKQQILDEMAKSENADLSEYAWWNNEDQTIEIDWDKINAVKDSELGDRIKEFVSTLEGFQSKYDEQIEALEDIESTLQEIEKRGRDQYTSLEDRVRDALIQQIQTQIDELTAVNEGISDANQKLFDSIQNTLELQRQERDNVKTEEELSDKEQRLAYLQQDSSGANAVEIAQLQEELADARESYTDQLIDQKISELQKQNDEAAEQRQEQIDLLQQSLDWQEKNGEFWEQAYQLMNNGIGPDGTLVTGSELEQLLKQGEGWQALSEEGKMNWLSELETMVAEAVGYLYLSRQLEKIGTKEGSEITFTDAEGNVHTGIVDKDGNVVINNGDGTQTIWKNVYQSYDGSYHTLETEDDARTEDRPTTSTASSGSTGSSTTSRIFRATQAYEGYNGTATSTISQNDANRKAIKNAINNAINNWKQDIKKFYGRMAANPNEDLEDDIVKLQEKIQVAEVELTKYKTGGLNTKTGPAWLDGTPSKPELVLNARDTENFIQLKDTLADLRKYGTSLGLNGGDNYYDIDVHVDEIGSDYDVDRLADRLKTLIYRDGQYRNVNTLNRLR